MDQLTTRQREIKDRLERGMAAREIGEELGITRNAVYQQIQALRRKGELAPGFTPSGAPARESVSLAGGESITAQLIATQLRVADELERLAAQMRSAVS